MDQYRSRYKTLEQEALTRLNFYGHEEAYPGEITANAIDMVDQLVIHAQNNSVDSFRFKKSAVLYHFNEGLKTVDPSSLDILMEQIRRASSLRSPPTAKKARKSTRNHIPEDDFETIFRALINYRGRSVDGGCLAAWLKAGLATGLRPNEWEGAVIEWIETEESPAAAPYLVCKNSKIKVSGPAFKDIEKAREAYPDLVIETVFDLDRNGISSTHNERSPTRRIPLSDEEAQLVQLHLDLIQEAEQSGKDFSQYYDSCRKLLERACRDLFKKRVNYTLYTLRHQYAANGKKIFSLAELAERMGHQSIKTAANSYAGNRHAHKSFKEAAQQQAKDAFDSNDPLRSAPMNAADR